LENDFLDILFFADRRNRSTISAEMKETVFFLKDLSEIIEARVGEKMTGAFCILTAAVTLKV
jgi:hypothetical protein